jgi:hypothetical protein
VKNVLEVERRMEEREWRNGESCYGAAEANEGNWMRNLMRTSLNTDKRQMAGTPVVCWFPSPYGIAPDLVSIKEATSKRYWRPFIQTAEPYELRAQQDD